MAAPPRGSQVPALSGALPGKKTLFGRIAEEDSLEAVREELDRGLKDPHECFPPKKQTLMFAAALRARRLGGSLLLASQLQGLGVPTTSVDAIGQTPLYYAAREGNMDCVTFLVKSRSDVAQRDANGQTPLFYAVRYGQVETCLLLRKLGGSFNTADFDGRTASYYATPQTRQALLQAGLNLPAPRAPAPTGSSEPVIQYTTVHPDPRGRKTTRHTGTMPLASNDRPHSAVAVGGNGGERGGGHDAVVPPGSAARLAPSSAPPVLPGDVGDAFVEEIASDPPTPQQGPKRRRLMTSMMSHSLPRSSVIVRDSRKAPSIFEQLQANGSIPSVNNVELHLSGANPRNGLGREMMGLFNHEPPRRKIRPLADEIAKRPQLPGADELLALASSHKFPRARSDRMARARQALAETSGVPEPTRAGAAATLAALRAASVAEIAPANSSGGIVVASSSSSVAVPSSLRESSRRHRETEGERLLRESREPALLSVMPPRIPPMDEVLAGETAPGSFFVCRPSLTDIPRLRELEREFVRDHRELFADEPWAEACTQADWYRSVNVIRPEQQALGAIRGILENRSGGHMTLQCVHRGAGALPSVVGYLHFVVSEWIDVSHLKVASTHRGLGLGALLFAGMARYAHRIGAGPCVADLRLLVMSKNLMAQKLYASLGFVLSARPERPGKQGVERIEWTKMSRVRELAHEDDNSEAEAFAQSCEDRAMSRRAVS